MTDTTVSASGVTLTEAAAAKAAALLAAEGRDDLALRIAVQPGAVRGCVMSCRSTIATSKAILSTPIRVSAWWSIG